MRYEVGGATLPESGIPVCPQCRGPLCFSEIMNNTVPTWYCSLHGVVYSPMWLYAAVSRNGTSTRPDRVPEWGML